jgi:hypothetical protein
MTTKSERRRNLKRIQRRAHIKRGMKIMLYELNQRLAPLGLKFDVPNGFYAYTIAIADGNRDEADDSDRLSACFFEALRDAKLLHVFLP